MNFLELREVLISSNLWGRRTKAWRKLFMLSNEKLSYLLILVTLFFWKVFGDKFSVNIQSSFCKLFKMVILTMVSGFIKSSPWYKLLLFSKVNNIKIQWMSVFFFSFSYFFFVCFFISIFSSCVPHVMHKNTLICNHLINPVKYI